MQASWNQDPRVGAKPESNDEWHEPVERCGDQGKLGNTGCRLAVATAFQVVLLQAFVSLLLRGRNSARVELGFLSDPASLTSVLCFGGGRWVTSILLGTTSTTIHKGSTWGLADDRSPTRDLRCSRGG